MRDAASLLLRPDPPLTTEEERMVTMVKEAFPGTKVVRHRQFCATRNPGVDAGAVDCTCGAERRGQIGPRKRRPPSLLSRVVSLESRIKQIMYLLRENATDAAIACTVDETGFRRCISDLKTTLEDFERDFNQACNQMDMTTNGGK